MVKKYIKLTVTILIFLLIINVSTMNSKVFAESIDVTQNLDYWADITQTNPGSTFTGMIKKIVSTVKYIGMIISIATLSVIGIKFMLGSVEEKAQYKQTLLPWLIGAILLFAITLIPDILYNGAQKLFP